MTQLIPAWDNGVLTALDKLDVHRRGLKHPAISVFLLAGDKTLIQQRAAHKYHTPNLWANTVCTHPHWEEPSLACATRRLGEELGISGCDLQFGQTVEYCADVGGGLTEHEVVDIYIARVKEDIAMVLNPEEVQAVRWIDFDTLAQEIKAAPEEFTPWLRVYMRDHRDWITAAT